MTAITPLEHVHKKGIFGDHHKKNESDLLQIAELKNFIIIQLVQYKRSKININQVKIDDLQIPEQSSQVNSNKDTRILWNAPSIWLVISKKENAIDIIKKNCNQMDFAITDISHSRSVIQIKGLQAKEVLKKGSPINFNEFFSNRCAGTVFHGISIVIDLVSEDPDTFNLLTLRSFGESFYHHITDSALEFGYVGV